MIGKLNAFNDRGLGCYLRRLVLAGKQDDVVGAIKADFRQRKVREFDGLRDTGISVAIVAAQKQ